MADQLIPIGRGFWNVRGSFKIGGVLDIGTQTSLAQLQNGRFVLLDAYAFEGPIEEQIMALTDNGQAIEAIINLHPFHTVHVKRVAKRFPDAKLYGTARHIEKAPELPWQPQHTNESTFHELYADDFIFSVPRGVTFIPDNEKLHFASVLATHLSSGALHVDDTLMWSDLPLVGGLTFHPTLRWVLEPRAGAANQFRYWAEELIEQCANVEHLCTAHAKTLPNLPAERIQIHIQEALDKVEDILHKHRQKYG